jgi:DNA-binding MarR family transcriptional regulator/NAD(P)-dependent dehydrogenase (short-subunit alcohol dehydrogenase family)
MLEPGLPEATSKPGIRTLLGIFDISAQAKVTLSTGVWEKREMTDELRLKPGHLIWRAYQLTWLLFAEEAGTLDITPVQEALLLVLAKRPGIDQKTLADLVALDRSTAGNVIGRLEERGLITRVPNDSDRRARMLSLTPRGEAVSRKLRPIAQRAAERLLAPLDPIERPEFMRLLRKVTGLADSLDTVGPKTPSISRLDGKKILIVGLTDEFGRQIAQRVSESAHSVQLPAPHVALQPGMDAEFTDCFKRACQHLGRVDVLVNGGNITGELLSTRNLEKAYAQIQETSGSRWTTILRVLPHFIEHGSGRIINLALFPNATISTHLLRAVVAANSAISALSRQVATDYRRSGIIANSISPRLEPSVQRDAEAPLDQRFVHVAPAAVALMISYLASEDARFVSASDLIIG